MTNDPHAEGAVLQAGALLETADLAMVLLHGRGGSAEDILSWAPRFNCRMSLTSRHRRQVTHGIRSRS
jgi:hypothetical protein